MGAMILAYDKLLANGVETLAALIPVVHLWSEKRFSIFDKDLGRGRRWDGEGSRGPVKEDAC